MAELPTADALSLLLGNKGTKKKKAGGSFSGLGESSVAGYQPFPSFPRSNGTPSHMAMYTHTGLSLPVVKGAMRKGYRLPTPIQRKVNAAKPLGVCTTVAFLLFSAYLSSWEERMLLPWPELVRERETEKDREREREREREPLMCVPLHCRVWKDSCLPSSNV